MVKNKSGAIDETNVFRIEPSEPFTPYGSRAVARDQTDISNLVSTDTIDFVDRRDLYNQDLWSKKDTTKAFDLSNLSDVRQHTINTVCRASC